MIAAQILPVTAWQPRQANWNQNCPVSGKSFTSYPVPLLPNLLGLYIHTLGKAQVRINGKMVTSSEWQTKSVRDLFFYFYIIAKPVTKEKIGAAFWPDISPAQLKLRFKNDIYRLRHALGQEIILFEDNLYRFNTDLDFESDIDQFESELVLARSTLDISQQVEHFQNAVDLVHGSYLEDIHADWAWHERERVDQMYISSLFSLSRLLLQKGSKAEALKICQRALDRDPCLEEAHQLAMQIYAAMQDRGAILRQYRLCQKILKNELGSAPSHETENVYQQVYLEISYQDSTPLRIFGKASLQPCPCASTPGSSQRAAVKVVILRFRLYFYHLFPAEACFFEASFEASLVVQLINFYKNQRRKL